MRNHWLYSGNWFALPAALSPWLAAARAINQVAPQQMPPVAPTNAEGVPLYQLSGGVAVIELAGMLINFDYEFDGTTNTVRARESIRAAAADKQVGAIMLRIESPGGMASGAKELSDAVTAANEKKPVVAYISDLGASAAYYAASGARQIIANETAEVGSIGTIAYLADDSKFYENMGIKVHQISTGELKGTGGPGQVVTPGQVAYVQEIVDGLNAFFLDAVKAGRELDKAGMAAVTTGRMWLAADAKRLGLIDQIQPWDEAFGQVAAKWGRRGQGAAMLAGRVKLAELKAGL